MMSDVIHIYRLGILSSSRIADWRDRRGRVAQADSEDDSARVWASCGADGARFAGAWVRVNSRCSRGLTEASLTIAEVAGHDAVDRQIFADCIVV